MKFLGGAFRVLFDYIYKSRNFMKLLGQVKRGGHHAIYKSRNFLKLLGDRTNSGAQRIYKSRNFLKLLGKYSTCYPLRIYKSRNFLKLLGCLEYRCCSKVYSLMSNFATNLRCGIVHRLISLHINIMEIYGIWAKYKIFQCGDKNIVIHI